MAVKVPASLRVIGRSFVDWWDNWIDMVLVTIIWFVAQLTIVLGPPATFGYFYYISQLVNGESLGARGMIKGARMYFGKSWQWGGLTLLVLIVLIVNFQFYGSISANWGIFLVAVMVMIAYFFMATNFYGLPYFMSLEQKSLKVAFKNGILTTLAAPFFTLILLLLSLVIIVASVGLILPFFMGLPGVIAIVGFRAMEDRLISFGLREREKNPKEIEAEQGGRIMVQGKDLASVSNMAIEDNKSDPLDPDNENDGKTAEDQIK